MGGMYCFKSARSDRFAKIASFYGMIRLPEGWHGPGQGEPLEHLAAGHPERVLAIIGERDPYTPPDDVTALEATGVSVVRYADAEHGFAHAPERPRPPPGRRRRRLPTRPDLADVLTGHLGSDPRCRRCSRSA